MSLRIRTPHAVHRDLESRALGRIMRARMQGSAAELARAEEYLQALRRDIRRATHPEICALEDFARSLERRLGPAIRERAAREEERRVKEALREEERRKKEARHEAKQAKRRAARRKTQQEQELLESSRAAAAQELRGLEARETFARVVLDPKRVEVSEAWKRIHAAVSAMAEFKKLMKGVVAVRVLRKSLRHADLAHRLLAMLASPLPPQLVERSSAFRFADCVRRHVYENACERLVLAMTADRSAAEIAQGTEGLVMAMAHEYNMSVVSMVALGRWHAFDVRTRAGRFLGDGSTRILTSLVDHLDQIFEADPDKTTVLYKPRPEVSAEDAVATAGNFPVEPIVFLVRGGRVLLSKILVVQRETPLTLQDHLELVMVASRRMGRA